MFKRKLREKDFNSFVRWFEGVFALRHNMPIHEEQRTNDPSQTVIRKTHKKVSNDGAGPFNDLTITSDALPLAGIVEMEWLNI